MVVSLSELILECSEFDDMFCKWCGSEYRALKRGKSRVIIERKNGSQYGF